MKVIQDSVRPVGGGVALAWLVTGCGLGHPGFESRQGYEFGISSDTSRPLLGTNRPPSQSVRLFYYTNKAISAEIMNEWSYTSTAPTRICLDGFSREGFSPPFFFFFGFQFINTELFKNSRKNFGDLNKITNDSKSE